MPHSRCMKNAPPVPRGRRRARRRAHGNQTQRSAQTVNRNVRYSASQDAYEITLASMFGTPPRSRFWYGPGGRYKREDSAQGSSTRRTVYLGNVEIITQGGQVQIKRYLAGGLAVQTLDGGLFGRPVTRYLYHDHLGSIVRVADANGALVEGADYGPFGERRGFAHPTGIPAIPETTNKGFTGHEMLDGLDIVHMNGRLYDNRLYRFMQPDPFVQSPGTPQNWNPYSYLWNNPLNGTDPSGYLGVKERQWLGVIITIVAMVTQNWWAVKWGLSATQVAWVYVAVGGVSGGVSSGSWNGALWGAFSAAVMAGAGSQFGGLSAPKRFFSMGMAGGVMSSLQGGKFGHGFVSAGTGAVMPGMVGKYIEGIQGQTVAAALVGGTISAMTGGKFANGAAMAAFSYAAGRDQGGGANPSPPPITDGGGDVASVEASVALLPSEVLAKLTAAGVEIVAVNDSVVEHLTHLRGVSPRGWPVGATFDTVPGVFDEASKTVVVATSGRYAHGSINIVLHEIGHAYDFVMGRPSRSFDFRIARYADRHGLTPYMGQAGRAGLSETFAESFANFYIKNYNFSSAHPKIWDYWEAR